MPNWKKLIVSGSDANLNSLDIATELTASDALITNDLDVLGKVGIGTTTPSYPLQISKNTVGNGFSINIFSTATKPNAQGGSVYSGFFSSIGNSSGTINDIVGSRNYAEHTGTGQSNFVVGSSHFAIHNGSGNSTGIYSIAPKAEIKGTGTGSHSFVLGVNSNTVLNNPNATVEYLQGVNINLKLTSGEVTDSVSGLVIDADGTGATLSGDFEYLRIQNDTLPSVTGYARSINSLSTLPSFFAGSIGIGTTNPTEKLQVTGNISASGDFIGRNFTGSSFTGSFVGDGSGLTNLSLSEPFVFNATSTTGIQSATNTASGDFSTAMGNNTSASGDYSTAMGNFTKASGTISTAMGNFTEASGTISTAMGRNTVASGESSTAMGRSTTASGSFSTAMGFSTEASGTISTAMGRDTEASGESSTAMGRNTVASGEVSTAMGRNTTANGFSSTAMGQDTSASGFYSTAMGESTEANGDFSTAMGASTIASGTISTAMGFYTTASGETSTAMGRNTVASGNQSTAMGRNTTANGFSSTAMGQDTQASGSFSTAMGNNTTAIGTFSTAMGFATTADGIYSSAMGNTTEASGTDSTAIGYFTKASGNTSTAMGRLTIASGFYSTAMGKNTVASATSSTAMGENTLASGYASTAMGFKTTASGYASIAMGEGAEASGIYSRAMGYNTKASADYSTAMGRFTEASGDASTAIGASTTATGDVSTAMGNNTEASGKYSTSMGRSTEASGYASTSIGQYNVINSGDSATTFAATNTAFSIGNGTGNASRSNALSVLFNGNTTSLGSVTATSFVGDGSGLTGLNSGSWDGIFSGSAQITGSLGVTGSYDQEANTTSAAATIKNTNNNGRGLDIWAANGGAGNNTILRLGTSSETVKMVVIENGNVGIGTTNPAQKLHISDSNARIRIQDSDGTNQYFELRQSGGDSIFTSRDNTNNGEFQFKLFDGTTTTTALRIFSTLNSTFAGSITATTMTLSSTTDQILNLDSTDDGAVYTALKRSNSRIGYVGFGGSGSTLTFANELSGTVNISNPAGSLAINPNGSATFTGNVAAPTFLGDLSGSINTLTTAVTKPDATNDTTVATTAFVQSLIGTIPAGLVFQGTWNAATNTPTLASGTGTTGHFYIVSTDGSTNLDGITDWKVGDWAVFVEQGATDAWEKVDNSSVLDGSGTGNQITKWAGSGTSNTLTNSIITDNGTNVGIGDTTPGRQLTLGGAAPVLSLHSTSLTGESSIYFGDTADDNEGRIVYSNSQDAMQIWTAASEAVRVTSAGSVGIGTTNPRAKLAVSFDGGHTTGTVGIENSSLDLYNPLEANTDEKGSILTFSDNYFDGTNYIPTTRAAIKGGTDSVSNIADGFLAFYTDSSGANTMPERMRIDHDGRVGIGTTAPNAPLSVHNTTSTLGSKVASFYHTNGTNNPFIEINSLSDGMQLKAGFSTGVAGHFDIKTLGGSSFITLSTNNTEAVRVTAAGNVGIGTTNPSAKLDVRTADGNSTSLRLGRIDNSSFWDFNHAGNDLRIYNSNGAGSNILLGVDPSGTVYDNKVGIGTSSPTEKLDVIGNIKASGSIQVGVNEGNPTAALVGSIRYKSDANNSFVDIVMQTDVTTYEWVNIVTNTW